MKLTALSLRRAAGASTLRAPSNEERARILRASLQAAQANNYPWPHRLREQYDPAPHTEVLSYANRRGI